MVDRADKIRARNAQSWTGGSDHGHGSNFGGSRFSLGSLFGGGNWFSGGGDYRSNRIRQERQAYWDNGGYPGADHGWGFGSGGGLFGGLISAISSLFGGHSYSRSHDRYEVAHDERDVVTSRQTAHIPERDVGDAAREAASSARTAGVIPADYLDLTAAERSTIQRQLRQEARAKEHEPRNVF